MSATEITNPYSILFGKEPLRSISRDKQLRQVIDDFSAQNPLMQLYMITGVRGSGKTVFLSDAADFFKKQEDWIVVSISSDGDILEKIVSELASENALARTCPHFSKCQHQPLIFRRRFRSFRFAEDQQCRSRTKENARKFKAPREKGVDSYG